MSEMRTIREQARDIPVFREVDVLVAGGGTAGMIAGLAAARAGAKTLVVERLNCLGGVFTAGMMTTTWTFNNQKDLIVKGIPLELMERLREAGATVPGDISKDCFTIYDTEMAKFVLADMYQKEPNAELLFYTTIADTIVEDGCVKGIIIENKSGRQAILAKVVVDATGDADVAARAGAEFMMADKKDLHPVSLLAKIAGIDTEAFLAYYKEHPEYIGNFTGGWQHSGFHSFRLTEELKDVEMPEELAYIRDWFFLYYDTPRPNTMIFNLTGEIEIDGTDGCDVTRGELVSMKRILDALEVFKRYIPGFKDAYIVQVASSIGVRETRRVLGGYVLTVEDILNNTKYEDGVCSYGAPVGVHTPDGKTANFYRLTPGTSYDIPFRCLVPKEINGLIVTGRCISVVPDATGSTRNMTCCMALGQSAGVAAALAAKQGVAPRDLKNKDLEQALLAQGVYLEGRS